MAIGARRPARDRPDRYGAGDDGDKADGLPQGGRGSGGTGARDDESDPFSGAVYVFRAKRADRVKLIYWGGTGVCLLTKRLEDGKFRWPARREQAMPPSVASTVDRCRSICRALR